jgi:hypothetical protein
MRPSLTLCGTFDQGSSTSSSSSSQQWACGTQPATGGHDKLQVFSSRWWWCRGRVRGKLVLSARSRTVFPRVSNAGVMMEACSVPSFSSTRELTAFGECVAVERTTCIRDLAVASRQVDGLAFFAVGIVRTAKGDVAEELIGGPVAVELNSVFGGVETQLGGGLGDVVFVSTDVCGEAGRRATFDGDERVAVIDPAREPVAVVCVLCSNLSWERRFPKISMSNRTGWRAMMTAALGECPVQVLDPSISKSSLDIVRALLARGANLLTTVSHVKRHRPILRLTGISHSKCKISLREIGSCAIGPSKRTLLLQHVFSGFDTER